MKVTYRGVSVPVVSAEVQAAVQEGQKAVAEADVHAEKTVEKYGTIVQTLEDALAKVHAAMVVDADGGAAQAKQLKLLEAYLRELVTCSNAERSLVLLRPLPEAITLSDEKGKKVTRPEEGVRLCDMAADELASLAELPHAEALEPGLEGLKVALRNQRLLYVGLVNASAGKVAEAVALFDLLRARLGDVPKAPTPALDRVQLVLAEANAELGSRVAKWRARILAQHELASSEAPPAPETAAVGAGAHFPPKVSPIACKPFVLDLAYQELAAPSFEEFIKQKSGLMGKLGSNVGKVAGWFRR